MKLTAREVHTYNDLVKQGKVPALSLPAFSEDAIIVTRVDEDDEVYFYDLVENISVYPGINTIKKIKDIIALLDKA